MRLVSLGLVRAFKGGKDVAARSYMMAASAMGATAFQKGLGAMHSVAHAVGGMFDTHRDRRAADARITLLGAQQPVVRGLSGLGDDAAA